MTTTHIEPCSVCEKRDTSWKHHDYEHWRLINCDNCGQHMFENNILNSKALSEFEKIVCKAAMNNRWPTIHCRDDNIPIIPSASLNLFKESYPNFSPIELLDNFLKYFCETSQAGQKFQLSNLDLAVGAGARTSDAADWIFDQAQNLGWLDRVNEARTQGHSLNNSSKWFMLSARAWSEFYERSKNAQNSKQAFMAMQFNNEGLAGTVLPLIREACSTAGFQLLAVNENRKAGLIDDKIRVDIRNSRFLVVDISDQNQGAYFEAGFAEGLGKPVFYICDKVVFDKHHNRENGKKTVHFDVEHQDIIIWDISNPADVAEELLASIRNTLPTEAIMTN